MALCVALCSTCPVLSQLIVLHISAAHSHAHKETHTIFIVQLFFIYALFI